MTWIKLCGLRSQDDLAVAADAGADAVGLVLAARSPRRISVGEAERLTGGSALPVYLVTQDHSPEDLVDAALRMGAAGIQPHGAHAETAAMVALSSGLAVLFPVPLGPGSQARPVPDGALPLFDGLDPGSGRRLDQSLLPIDQGSRFVLAGGLTPDNVADAIGALHPYGVDVSSGIERERGLKDHDLMRAFVTAVRR